MTEPFVVLPGEGKILEMGNFEVAVLAESSQTSAAFTFLETRREPTGFGPPMHIHHDAAEAFYVLEGVYLMMFADRQEECPPGSFVYVPRAVRHTFTVVSETPGRKLNLFAPGAMVGFFEELSAAELTGTATPERLDDIARRHQMEVVGPVPDIYL